MLFVFLSHFVEAYLVRHDLPVSRVFAVRMLASPAFITISGIILGILYCARGERFRQTQWRFIWRGAFLLSFGRILIFLAHIPHAGGWNEALRWAYMTDAIGFCILLGPWAIQHVGPGFRAAAGICIYAFSWAAGLLWDPGGDFLRMTKEFLFGPSLTGPRFFTDVFPVLPWFGLYLIATVIGERMGARIVSGERERAIHMVLCTGLVFAGASAVLFAGRWFLERWLGFASYGTHVFLSPLQKLPPGGVYYLLFAGCTFFLLWVLMRFSAVRLVDWYASIVEVIGRNSLFVFIVQYFVYFTVIEMLNLKNTMIWPLYLAVSVVVIWCTALAWEKGKKRLQPSKAGR